MLKGCADGGLRAIAIILTLIFGAVSLFVLYTIFSGDADPEIARLLFITVIITLACGSIAFQWKPKVHKPKNNLARSGITCWQFFVRAQAGLLAIGFGLVVFHYIGVSIRDSTLQYWFIILICGFFSFVCIQIVFRSNKDDDDDSHNKKKNDELDDIDWDSLMD